MIFNIQLTIEGDITSADVSITVDNYPAEFTIVNNLININASSAGLHILKLKNNTNKRFKILQVKVGDCDLRKLLYLSYLENQTGETFQPATEFWEENQTWVLPFGYPVSYWIEAVEQQITNGKFGQSLKDEFNFFYPASVKLATTKFPQMVRDFFEHNFNFTAINKLDLDANKIPYTTYLPEISKELIEDAKLEISTNLESILANKSPTAQDKDNRKEFQQSYDNLEWQRIWMYHETKPMASVKKFPAVQKLIDSLNLDIWHSFIGILPPGGFIYPHKDMDLANLTNKNYENYQGCTQIYIPIQWPGDNFIKFAGAGTLAFDDGQAMVINTDHYTHCVVNGSDQYRFVLAVRAHKDILKNCRIIK